MRHTVDSEEYMCQKRSDFVVWPISIIFSKLCSFPYIHGSTKPMDTDVIISIIKPFEYQREKIWHNRAYMINLKCVAQWFLLWTKSLFFKEDYKDGSFFDVACFFLFSICVPCIFIMIVRMRRKGVVVGEGNARLISVFDHQTILRSLVSMNIRRKIVFCLFSLSC